MINFGKKQKQKIGCFNWIIEKNVLMWIGKKKKNVSILVIKL